MAKAVRSNRVYARVVGWADRYEQVVRVLGFTDMSPGEESFASAVAEWQSQHPPLAVDGMLGPNTWARMEPLTAFTPAPSSTPEWARAPLPDRDDPATEHISTNIWFGIGVNYGGHFFAIGKNTGHTWLISADD
jgi:hypothetical protein